MYSFLVSTAAVTLAEIGDKTQLLAFMLASRYRQPLPIIAGILVATLLNHGLAGALGQWLHGLLNPDWLRWGLGLSFIAMAFWVLIPDSLDDEPKLLNSTNLFWLTCVSFFIVEMGDKTQVATIALAIRYNDWWQVVFGSTLGMLLANVPVVLLGRFSADRLPLTLIRRLSAALFAVLGLLLLW